MYNTVRLHSAIGYITPKDKLQGHAEQIFAERDRKLEAARQARRQRRSALTGAALADTSVPVPPPAQETAP